MRTPRAAQLIHNVGKSASLLAYELCRARTISSSPALDRLVHFSNIADFFLPDAPDFILSTDYANLVKIYGFWNVLELIHGNLENAAQSSPAPGNGGETSRGKSYRLRVGSKSRVQRVALEVGYVETVVGNANSIVHRMLDEKVYALIRSCSPCTAKETDVMVVSLRSRTGEALKVCGKIPWRRTPKRSGIHATKVRAELRDALEYLRRTLDPFKQEEIGV